MATVDADTLLVRVAADVSSLQGELKKATDAMAKAMATQAKETKQLNDALGRVGATIKGTIMGALGGLSIGKIVSMTRESLQWAESLQRTANWLGISATNLQAYEEGAAAAGIEQGKFTQALEKMMGNLADAAADPQSGPAQIFRQLGIALRDVNGQLKTADVILPQLADKIKNLGQGDKLLVGKTLFGDRMDEVVKVLAGGSDALARMRSEFAKLNPEFGEQVRKGAELNAEFAKMERQISTTLRQALIDLGPVLTSLIGLVSQMSGGLSRAIRIATDPKFANEFANKLDRESEAMLPPGLRRALKPELKANRGQVDAAERRRLMEQSALNAGLRGLGEDVPGIPGEPKPDRLKTGGEDEFAKKIREMQREARALSDQLAFDKPTADLKRLTDEFAAGNGKIAPTRAQVEAFAEALKLKQSREGLVALKDMRAEEIALAQSSMLEASGQREAAEALRIKFELEKKYGPAFAASQEQWIRQMARYKVASADAAEQMRGSMQELQGFVQIGASSMTDAIQAFSDKSKNAMEELRRIGASVMQQLANMALRLALFNPLQNWANGDNRLPTIGSVANAASNILARLGGGGVDASGVGLPGRAAGGPIAANTPYLVGEKGPEIITSSRSAYVNPNGALGGSIYYIDARGADQAGLARLEAMIRQVNGSVEHRSVAAVFNARTRGGKFARAF